jgi:hypothetical protein
MDFFKEIALYLGQWKEVVLTEVREQTGAEGGDNAPL